jgi:hypothetical protein
MPSKNDIIDVAREIVRAWDNLPNSVKAHLDVGNLGMWITQARRMVGDGAFGGGASPSPAEARRARLQSIQEDRQAGRGGSYDMGEEERRLLREIAADEEARYHSVGQAGDPNVQRGGAGGSGRTYGSGGGYTRK